MATTSTQGSGDISITVEFTFVTLRTLLFNLIFIMDAVGADANAYGSG